MVKVNPRPGLVYALDGYLKQNLDSYKKAVHEHNTSVVMVIDGRSGMGKTTLSNQIGTYLDPTFGLDKMFYDPEDFLKGLAEAKKGDYICFDEAMIISNRSAVSAINKMIIQAMSMIRSKNIFVTFCVNSIFDLDRNLALSRADTLYHVYGDNLIDRGQFTAFFKANESRDNLKLLYLLGKKMYDYSRPRANYFGTFPPNFILNERNYEARKQRAVKRFLERTGETTSKAQMERNRLVVYMKDTLKVGATEISQAAKIGLRTVYNIMDKYGKKPKKKKEVEF